MFALVLSLPSPSIIHISLITEVEQTQKLLTNEDKGECAGQPRTVDNLCVICKAG